MINIAFRMTGDYDDACEVVQEAFLSAYRSIRKFRGDARFSTWLYGICLNHARNRLSQVARRSHYEVQSLDDPVDDPAGSGVFEPAAGDLPALDQLERKELQEKVQKCIDSLEEPHREVLVLRDIEGFSYEEIADILQDTRRNDQIAPFPSPGYLAQKFEDGRLETTDGVSEDPGETARLS